jgi:hypothetical protein
MQSNVTIRQRVGTMEVNQLRRQLKDLQERMSSLRGYL